MGAGEPGMISPSPPTHGPLARAAELRWTSATRWVCPVPLFPCSRLRVTKKIFHFFCDSFMSLPTSPLSPRSSSRAKLNLPKVIFGTSSLGNLFAEPSHEEKLAVVKAIFEASEVPMFDSAVSANDTPHVARLSRVGPWCVQTRAAPPKYPPRISSFGVGELPDPGTGRKRPRPASPKSSHQFLQATVRVGVNTVCPLPTGCHASHLVEHAAYPPGTNNRHH